MKKTMRNSAKLIYTVDKGDDKKQKEFVIDKTECWKHKLLTTKDSVRHTYMMFHNKVQIIASLWQ